MGYSPALNPFFAPIPADNLAVGGNVCLSIPRAMVPFLLGALEPLIWPEAWTGSADTVVRAMGIVERFMVDLATMKPCSEHETPVPDCPTCQPADGSRFIDFFGAHLDLRMRLIAMGILNLEWRDGELWMQRYPCCTWERVGGKSADGHELDRAPRIEPPLPLPEDNEAIEVDTRCRIATRLTEALRDIYDYVSEHYEDPLLAWDIRGVYPQYSIDRASILAMQAFIAVDILSAGGTFTQFVNEDWERVRCLIYERLTPDRYDLTEDQHTRIGSAMLLKLVLSQPGYASLLQNAWYALGAGTAQDIARSAVGWIGADPVCNCGTAAPTPSYGDLSGYDWAHVFDFREGMHGFFDFGNPFNASQIDGVGVVKTDPAVNGFKIRKNVSDVPAFQPHFTYVEYEVDPGYDYEYSELTAGFTGGAIVRRANTGDADPSVGGIFRGTAYSDVTLGGQQGLVFELTHETNQQPAQTLRMIVVAGYGADPFPAE